MQIVLNSNGYIIIDNIQKHEIDLDKTFNCGQCFRWYKDEDNWVGVIYNKIVILRQYDNYILTNLKEYDTELIINYLNLDIDYTSEIGKLELDNFAKKSYEYSKGIHILRQDLFETMVTFLMSSCNTINNIRNIINLLCKTYGNKITTNWENKEYVDYTFPSLEVLSNITESEFRQLSMGFRAAYLVNMCHDLYVDKDRLQSIINKDSVNELCKFNGIGKKVANCICLFALHDTKAFPIDTHIRQIIDSEYSGCIDIGKYGNYAGIIQQYMFYYKAFYM